ncbi:hypothetical protein TI05_12970 [Achromatium sp. WMS3]|nr:hypothetical protein TI05_12970 [Achromatium sp. WMS3]
MEADPWPPADYRPSVTERLESLLEHEIEEPWNEIAKPGTLDEALQCLYKPYWGHKPDLPKSGKKLAANLNIDDELTWYAWAAASTRLAKNANKGWPASITILLSWFKRTAELESYRREIIQVQAMAEAKQVQPALKILRTRILHPDNNLSPEAEKIRQQMGDMYITCFKKGLLPMDIDILFLLAGVLYWVQGAGKNNFSWLHKLRDPWDLKELTTLSEQLCLLFSNANFEAIENIDNYKIIKHSFQDTDGLVENVLQVIATAASCKQFRLANSLCNKLRYALDNVNEPGKNFANLYARTLKLQALVGDTNEAHQIMAQAVYAVRNKSLAVSLPLLSGLACIETQRNNLATAQKLFCAAFQETKKLEYDRLALQYTNEQVKAITGKDKPKYLRDTAEQQILTDLIEALNNRPQLVNADFLHQVLQPVQSLKALTNIAKTLYSSVKNINLIWFKSLFAQIKAIPDFATLRMELGDIKADDPDILKIIPDAATAFTGLIKAAIGQDYNDPVAANKLIMAAHSRIKEIRSHELAKTFSTTGNALKKALHGDKNIAPLSAGIAQPILNALIAITQHFESEDQISKLNSIVLILAKDTKRPRPSFNKKYQSMIVNLANHVIPRLPLLYKMPISKETDGYRAWPQQIKQALPLLEDWHNDYQQQIRPLQQRYSTAHSKLMDGDYSLYDEASSLERRINEIPDYCNALQTSYIIALTLSQLLQEVSVLDAAKFLRLQVLEGSHQFPPYEDYINRLVRDIIIPLIRAFNDAGEHNNAELTFALLHNIANSINTNEECDEFMAALFGYNRIRYPDDDDWSTWPEDYAVKIVQLVTKMLQRYPGCDYSKSSTLLSAIDNAANAGFTQAATYLFSQLANELPTKIADVRAKSLAKLGLTPEVIQIFQHQDVNARLRSINDILNTAVINDKTLWRYIVEQALNEKQDLFEQVVMQRLAAE